MKHIHNETVLSFLKEHRDNANVKKFLEGQKEGIKELNKELGESYEDYLDYLEQNIGDDASFTIEELKALLGTKFVIKLSNRERKEFSYDSVEISVEELNQPVHIKDEGDFFSVWSKKGRIDVPLKFLDKFISFLKSAGVKYENEYEM